MFHITLLKGITLNLTHGHVCGLKCHTVLGLCLNMLYPLFQFFTDYIQRDGLIKAYIKLVVAQDIKTLEIIVFKNPTFYTIYFTLKIS